MSQYDLRMQAGECEFPMCRRLYDVTPHPNPDFATIPVAIGDVSDQYARRLAACVNACQGIPTEALEAGVVGDLVAVFQRQEDIIRNILTDSQLDVRSECGRTLREYVATVRQVLAKLNP